LPATVTFTRIAGGTLDDDNLAGACKPFRDGCIGFLGIRDDSPAAPVTWHYAQRRPSSPAEITELRDLDSVVEITIEPVSEVVDGLPHPGPQIRGEEP
jgi:hypothetical protein